MIKGILRPTETTKDAWLFPIMKSPPGKALADYPKHYPKPPMVVQAGGLQAVLDDKTLHCVCGNLCCDRQVVFVAGSHTIEIEEGKGAAELSSILDGEGKNWGLKLALVPLAGRCRLRIISKVDRDIEDTGKAVIVRIERMISLLRNTLGVVFYDFDFEIVVRINCVAENLDMVKIEFATKAACVEGCGGSAFVRCTAKIRVDARAAGKDKPPPEDEYRPGNPDDDDDDDGDGTGDGGGGGGIGPGDGGGGGGGHGWDENSYGFPRDEDEDPTPDPGTDKTAGLGRIDNRFHLVNFDGCVKSIFTKCEALISLDCDTISGTESLCYSWRQCGGINRGGSAEIKNIVRVSGIKEKDGIDMSARAESRIIAANRGELSGFRGSADTRALCEGAPGEGIEVIGMAEALSLGVVGSAGVVKNSAITLSAAATHPAAWAARTAASAGNSAQMEGNNFPGASCRSNIPGYCEIPID